MKIVEVSEGECWAIEYTVRSREMNDPRRLERDLLLKVMAILVEFEDRRGKPFPPKYLPLALTEDECWLIVQRVPFDMVLSGEHVGRSVLLKTFRILLEYANERESAGGVATLMDLLRLRSPAQGEAASEGQNGSQEAGGSDTGDEPSPR